MSQSTIPERLMKVYQATLNEDWKGMEDYLKVNATMVLASITGSRDCALHLAVYSKKRYPLEPLLEIAQKDRRRILKNPFTLTNANGNTILHEAAVAGNLEAVKYLLSVKERVSEQLTKTNNSGETPFFTAASFGREDIVDYISKTFERQIITKDGKLGEKHRRRTDSDSKTILSAAIQGLYFETAVKLLKLDSSLGESKELPNGRTYLHLLAEMPFAFKSGYATNKFGKFLYCCLETKKERRQGNGSGGDQSRDKQGLGHETKKERRQDNGSEGDRSCDKQDKDCDRIGTGSKADDLELGTKATKGGRHQVDACLSHLFPVRKKIGSICQLVWPDVKKFRKEMGKHALALDLTRLLIKNQPDYWCNYFIKLCCEGIKPSTPNGRQKDDQRSSTSPNPLFISTRNGIIKIVEEILDTCPTAVELAGDSKQNTFHVAAMHRQIEANKMTKIDCLTSASFNGNEEQRGDKDQNKKRSPSSNPLFIATRKGIIEIVKEILETCPAAVELIDDSKQNILHVAVMHRQGEIFDHIVKKNQMVLGKIGSKIDNKGYTLLHQVADNKHYRGGTKPGPALQLQEEMQWFQRVKEVVPTYLHMNIDTENKMTAKELFEKKHAEQLNKAQDWIKQTSQSCSAVAVLVATVVFAAAYTIPGGSNDQGFPIFLGNRFFLGFITLDVIALASSLTSVVMFLSMLTTSSDQCEKFRVDIPRKLIWGFTLLSFSVMTTMLAFACTLVLIIDLKQWTDGLISVVLFLPVLVFAGIETSLYMACFGTVKDFYKEIINSLPWKHQDNVAEENKEKEYK